MTKTRPSPWAGLKLLAVVPILVGGFVLWGLIQFGPRDIPAGAAPCPQRDWTALNTEGVEFGSIYNSTDRAEQNSQNGILARNGDPQPRCLQIFDDKTCNLFGPTLVRVNRPDGPIIVALDEGQTARLHNNPRRPFACGLLEPTIVP